MLADIDTCGSFEQIKTSTNRISDIAATIDFEFEISMIHIGFTTNVGDRMSACQ